MRFADMQAATGHRYIDYAFTNVGSTSCHLRGYPGATLLKQSGQAKTNPRAQVRDNPVSPIRTVVIEPGKHAFFTFSWGDGGFCPGNSFTFYGLRIVPPNDRLGFRRGFGATSACANSAEVTAVRPKWFTF